LIQPAATGTARLFFALWPDPGVRDALAALATGVQAPCGGRATRRENIHLTLFFVGEVERTRLAEVRAAAATLRGARFELVLHRLGYFRRARIAWLGADCPAALASLVAQLTQNLAAVGIEGEDRPYVPHITLVREAARQPAGVVFDPVIWRAHEFVLVESVRGRSGSTYEIVQRWELA
jgi:RNA 2',3'-cyclic 3'-phosphodiesterase